MTTPSGPDGPGPTWQQVVVMVAFIAFLAAVAIWGH